MSDPDEQEAIIGRSLTVIRDGQLWRVRGYETFEAYCLVHLKMDEEEVERCINCYEQKHG
jgi:hypothetical protein